SSAQQIFENTAPSKYRVVFKDKGTSEYSIEEPEKFLSPAALERRRKHGIQVTESDLPVSTYYINTIQDYGVRVLSVSKWFNSITIEVNDSTVLPQIGALTFVDKHVVTAHETYKTKTAVSRNNMSLNLFDQMNYGPSWWQTAVHNGQLLHNNGFTGNGITIALLDAGFSNVDTLPVFNRLFENGRIIGTRDFVQPGNSVYREATHGMSVLSIIGGYQSEGLIGTAPDASFWLLRSEDGGSEYIIEEDNWIAAAEFADSAGADIINTSLGYSVFNDSTQNHTYADMDGNTTRVSKAADIAASKGMIVIVSAGNQGNAKWKYITAPADADSVLTVGAIDRSKTIASFSSRGPSSDGRIKPNVVSIGQGVFVGNIDGSIRQGNGTSFSAPVITGLTACLWQANPEAKAGEIYSAIIESSDRFYNPNSDYGYGVPDFHLANLLLKAKSHSLESDARVTAFPNPFYNQLYIFFKEPVSSSISIKLFDLAGKEVFQKTYAGIPDRNFLVIDSDFDSIQKGIYIIRIQAGGVSGNSKLIKY
ncbi:MAG TPA: S8 family serine peptidase, partial [Bacteroidales bacterium]|nr:S8 family serine peptidase [Bacteroidales bacterium]